MGNVSYRNILDGYTSGKNKKKSLDLKTDVGDILFNQSDENAIKEEEFINVSSPDSNENSDSNEENINTNEGNN